MNHLTDRTDEELRALLGFKPSRAKLLSKTATPPAAPALPAAFETLDEASASASSMLLRASSSPSRRERRRGMTVLPEAVDWRLADPPVLTPPKDQGACGSCWTFSGTGQCGSGVRARMHAHAHVVVCCKGCVD